MAASARELTMESEPSISTRIFAGVAARALVVKVGRDHHADPGAPRDDRRARATSVLSVTWRIAKVLVARS